MPIPQLLAGGARLLRRGAIKDPAAVYAHSRPVERLSFFISHAWTSPWITKLVALWFYFNATLATIVMLILTACAIYVELFMAHCIPEFFFMMDTSRVDGTLFTRSFFCSAVAAIAFPLLLLHIHNWNRRSEYAFLDVACVDQMDAVNKAKGIAQLGAVLARSERLGAFGGSASLVDRLTQHPPPPPIG